MPGEGRYFWKDKGENQMVSDRPSHLLLPLRKVLLNLGHQLRLSRISRQVPDRISAERRTAL